MNSWSERTIKVARKQNYLDQLQLIYPHEDGIREIRQDRLDAIREYYELRDDEKPLMIHGTFDEGYSGFG